MICILFTGVGQCQMCLQKICYDPAFRYIFLSLTFVYGRKLSCHVFTHMATMASITFSTFIFSSQLGIQDWKKYEISFKLKKQGAMKHMSGEVCRPFFFFQRLGVVWRSPVALGVELLRGFWRVVPVSQDDGIQRMSAIGMYLRWRFVEDLEGLYGTANVSYSSQIARYTAWYRAKYSTLQIC